MVIVFVGIVSVAAKESDESRFRTGGFPDESSNLRRQSHEDSEGRLVVCLSDDLVRGFDFCGFKISVGRYTRRRESQLSRRLWIFIGKCLLFQGEDIFFRITMTTRSLF
jgi:hypothetical protein